ncbi:unnamed protein product [Callosobruchus maculatus]|uniref:PHD-type domain-containing protein n=1 Tax=Callosobruchus maculatus TaxID=64391 RepID=A0A653CXG3_CALMS|nr:unnamed protein product [Callosobruchus maculatus]
MAPKLLCGKCSKTIGKSKIKIGCFGSCGNWFHEDCTGLNESEIIELQNEEKPWFCEACAETESKLKSTAMPVTPRRVTQSSSKANVVFPTKLQSLNSSLNNSSFDLDLEDLNISREDDLNSTVMDMENSNEVTQETLLRQENKYLKMILKHKNYIIKQQERQIKTLQEKSAKNQQQPATLQKNVNQPPKEQKAAVKNAKSKSSKASRTTGNVESKQNSAEKTSDSDTGTAVVENEQQQKITNSQVSRAIHEATQVNKVKLQTKKPDLPQTQVVGTNSTITGLKAAERRSWFYIGNLNPETTVESLKSHMEGCNISTLCCEKLQTKNSEFSACFKIAINPNTTEVLLNAENWPTDTNIKPFRFNQPHRPNRMASKKSTVEKHTFSTFNKDMFKYLLSKEKWETIFKNDENDVNMQWQSFMNIISPLFDYCFPIKNISLQSKKSPKKRIYCTPELIHVKKELDILYTMKQIQPEYTEVYRKTKNMYNALLASSRKQFYANRIQTSDNKSKTVWQIVGEVKGTSNSRSEIRVPGNGPELASKFNNLTINKVSELVENLPKVPFTTNISRNVQTMILKPLTETETFNIIKKLKNKCSSGFDKISNNLIKHCIHELVEPLTYIVNNSFNTGKFPESLKLSLVKPLYKKGDPLDLINYRPISLTSSFSKIFELAMSSRLLEFFDKYKLFSRSQHSFLKGKNVVTAVYEFVDRIGECLEKKRFSMGMFLDFTRAFNSLDHAILLEKLELYGVRGKTLDWIREFMSGREQSQHTTPGVLPREVC